MMVPYGRLAPDAGYFAPNVCLEAHGVLPLEMGYGPAPGPNVPSTATALGGDPLGLQSFIKRDGTWKVFGYTETDILEMASDYTWSSLSSAFSCTAGDYWSSGQFGNFLLSTNTTDGLQAYDVETPAGFSAVADAGDPRVIFETGNILFALDCLDEDGNRDNRLIRSSDYNSHTNWTTGAADYQPLETGGALLAGIPLGNGYAIVVQDRALRSIHVGGGVTNWSMALVSDGMGAVGGPSCVGYDGAAYGVATDGFWQFTMGGGVRRIGAGRIDQWFFDNVNTSELPLVQAAIDPFNKMVWWRAPSWTSDIGRLGYSWQWDCWVTSPTIASFFGRIATPGITYATYTGTYADADEHFNSRSLQGGQPVFGILNSDGKFATLDGQYVAARLRTSRINSAARSIIRVATPIDDSADGTLAITMGVANMGVGASTSSNSKARNGAVPLRAKGSNLAFQRDISAASSWTFAKGIDHINQGAPR